MKLNIKKFIISMLIFFAFFFIISVCMVLTNTWAVWGKEVKLMLSLGFCISAIINLLKPDNYKNDEK